jgi:hypothetical protein
LEEAAISGVGGLGAVESAEKSGKKELTEPLAAKLEDIVKNVADIHGIKDKKTIGVLNAPYLT